MIIVLIFVALALLFLIANYKYWKIFPDLEETNEQTER